MTMAKMGFDWLTVDSEHSPIDVSTQSLMCYAIAKEGCVPLVRVPFNCESDIKRALDGGAYGVVVPMVKSRKEAEEVVSYVKYPPVGIRSRGGSMHTLTFDCDGNTYFARANDETLCVIQIEHIDAVRAADEILSVPGVDAVFIGPNDLMASMGLPPTEGNRPEVVAAINEVLEAANRNNVAPGIHVTAAVNVGQAVQQRIDQGFRFIALSTDSRLMSMGAIQELQAVQRVRK